MTAANPAESSPRAVPPGARSAVALLLAINLFNYIDRYILAAVEPRISEDLLKGDPRALAKMGSLATAFILSYMLAAPVFGWLADRMSRWLLVGIGVIVWSLASGGSGLAPTFTVLLITRLFVGIGEAGYGPAAPTIISDLYPVERRGFVLSFFYMAIPVGSALGYIWGGKIEALMNWRWAFYTVVPPGLLLGALALYRRDPRDAARREAKSAAPKHGKLADYAALFRNRSFMLDCIGMTLMTFAIGGISYWMPHYIAEYRNAGTLEHVNFVFGALTAIAGVSATLLGGLAGDALRSKFSGSYFLVSGAGIFISCPFVLLMLHAPFPLAWVWAFIAMFFLFFNTGPSNTILANVTSPSIRSSAFALNILFIHALGDAISPPILGAVVGKAARWDLAFYIVTGVMALAGVVWMFGARYLEEDTRRAEAVNQPPMNTGEHG